MSHSSSIFPSIHKRLASLHRGGILICDPQRLDGFLKGTSRYRDLSSLFDGSKVNDLFIEGIAAALPDYSADEYIVVVRHRDSPTYISDTLGSSFSEGWILGTASGSLALCSFDSLLFWNPDNEEDGLVDEEDDLIRYVSFTVPPGWYRVAILAGKHSGYEDDGDTEWPTIEFVMTPTSERPLFSEINHKHNPSSTDSDLIQITPYEIPKKQLLEPFIDKELLRNVLSRFTQNAFGSFIRGLFNVGRQSCELFESLEGAGEGVYCQPILDSYGESLHRAYILHYLPLGLFRHPHLAQLIDEPTLVPRLENIRDIYKNACGHWGMVSPYLTAAVKLQSLGFLLNLSGIQRDQYEDEIFPQYGQLLEKVGLHTPTMLVGSYDSFIDLNVSGVDKALKNFLISNSECISIQLGSEHRRVSRFTAENSFLSGVLKSNKCPYEPLFENVLKANEHILDEFESLLQKDVREAELEKFLVAHYKDIFGNKYDRIETQIWLRFPELDIAGRDRRLDIFMRNSLSNDWELFEVKKVIPLTRNYRDIPVIASEITYAVQQLKNYSRNLLQYSVRERLARDGIEYFVPTLHLVAGRTPQISHEQWRWLLSSQDKDVRITTYDDLLAEMRLRLSENVRFLGMLNQNGEPDAD
jgi:hypothetical protein